MRTTLSLCLLLWSALAFGEVPEWAVGATVKVIDHGRGVAGSGAAVDYCPLSKTCWVLTCKHVVGGPGELAVEDHAGRQVAAKFVGTHTKADVSILEVPATVVEFYVPIARRGLEMDEAICQV